MKGKYIIVKKRLFLENRGKRADKVVGVTTEIKA